MKKYTRLLALALNSAFFCLPFISQALPPDESSKQRQELARAVAFGFGSGDRLLWRHTYQPAQRDMLYEPLFDGTILAHNNQSVTLFFTRASKLAYGLGDLVDLRVVQDIATQGLEMKFAFEQLAPEPQEDDPEFVDDLDAYQAAYDAYLAYAPARAAAVAKEIVDCAKQITFQEHRIGAALNKKWHYDQLYISARTWVGLAERNYWLDEEYRDRISAAMKQLFPSNDGTFTMSDYVTMNWGIGDTHLKAGWITPITDGCSYRAGVKLVLPTATEGKRGTAYKIIPLRLDQFASYGRTRLNEVLIAPRLGNGGHVGIGVWQSLSWKKSFFNDRHQLKIQGQAAADYLFEGTEERLLMRYVDKEVVSLKNTFRNSNDGAFRAFIGQFILPEPVEVSVAPGAILTAGLTARYCVDKTRFFLGYDWYCKDCEKLVRCVEPSDALVYIPDQERVDVGKSIQHKVFGGVSYSGIHKNVKIAGYTWSQLGLSCGVHGAASLSAAGMGKDFGLGVSFGVKC